MPPSDALEVAAKVRTHAQGIARVFIDLFMESVWKPFNRAGRPEEEWPKVRDALERLRPLASEAMLAIFQEVMSEEVEQATARDLQRALREPRERGRGRGRHASAAVSSLHPSGVEADGGGRIRTCEGLARRFTGAVR